jgi:hypothetical protein
MEELELKWKPREDIDEWLISFYRGRMLYFMNNIGGITEYNTVITPRLLMITMKRYGQLVEEQHDIDRRLSW